MRLLVLVFLISLTNSYSFFSAFEVVHWDQLPVKEFQASCQNTNDSRVELIAKSPDEIKTLFLIKASEVLDQELLNFREVILADSDELDSEAVVEIKFLESLQKTNILVQSNAPESESVLSIEKARKSGTERVIQKKIRRSELKYYYLYYDFDQPVEDGGYYYTLPLSGCVQDKNSGITEQNG